MSSSNAFRTTAAALLFATLLSLTAPPAAQAWGLGRHSVDGPTREVEVRERGILSYLLRLFDFAGGAMDPNGNS